MATTYNLWFRRNIKTADYNDWSTRRNTGFSASWHVEDTAGQRVEIQSWDEYGTEFMNKEFVRLVNIVHHAISVHNISVDKVWQDIKILNQEMNAEAADYETLCDYGLKKDDIIKGILDEEERKLNMSGVRGPVYKDYLTNSTLDISAFFLPIDNIQ